MSQTAPSLRNHLVACSKKKIPKVGQLVWIRAVGFNGKKFKASGKVVLISQHKDVVEVQFDEEQTWRIARVDKYLKVVEV